MRVGGTANKFSTNHWVVDASMLGRSCVTLSMQSENINIKQERK
jgi:hypothetical protein